MSMEWTRKIHCPDCGQRLQVSTIDLKQSVICPRCGMVHFLDALLPRDLTLQAIPAGVIAEAAAARTPPAPAAQAIPDARLPSHVAAARLTASPARFPEPRYLERHSPAPPAVETRARPHDGRTPPGACVSDFAIVSPAPPRAEAPAPPPPRSVEIGAWIQQAPFSPAPPVVAPLPPPAPPVAGLPPPPPPPPPAPDAGANLAPAAGPIPVERSGLLSAVAVLDTRLARWRTRILVIVVSGFGLAPVVDAVAEVHRSATLTFANVSAGLLTVVCAVFGLAFLDRCRGEDGRITLAGIASELGGSGELGDSPPSVEGDVENERERYMRRAKWAIGAGGVVLAVARILLAFGEDIPALHLLGLGAFAVGCGVWVYNWHQLREEGIRKGLVVDGSNVQAQQALVAAVQRMPEIINCSDVGAVHRAALVAGHPLLSQFLSSLVGWHPRRFTHEHSYREDLLKVLKRKMPAAMPKTEYPVAENQELIRVDLVLGDVVGCELKRHLSSTTARNASAQIDRYLRLWRKGPVVFLACHSDPELVRRYFAEAVQRWRRENRPVVVLVLPDARRE